MCTVWKNLSCNEGGSTLECFLFWVNFLDKIPLRCIHWNLDFCHWFFWTVQCLWEPTVMRGNSLPWLHYSSTSFKAGRRAKFAHQSANRDLGDFPSLPYQLLRGGQPYGYLLRWGQLCSPLVSSRTGQGPLSVARLSEKMTRRPPLLLIGEKKGLSSRFTRLTHKK